jgi:hypothetical protein
MAEYRCTDVHCNNHLKYCMVYKNQHYSLTTDDLKGWSFAIIKNEANVLLPPLSCNPILREQNKTTKTTKKRQSKHFSSDNDSDYHSLRRYQRSSSGSHSHGRRRSWHQSDDSLLPPTPKTDVSASSSNTRSVHSVLAMPIPSSPVGNDANPVAQIDEFITWEIERIPDYKDALELASQSLKRYMFELNDIRKMDLNKWEGYGIPEGLGKRLSKDVKIFWKSRD